MMNDNSDATWFDDADADGLRVAVITDDLLVHVDRLGTVTICGWEGVRIHLDFDDAVDVAEVLAEAVQILRATGHVSGYQKRRGDASVRDDGEVLNGAAEQQIANTDGEQSSTSATAEQRW
jgi:hypothetical protein